MFNIQMKQIRYAVLGAGLVGMALRALLYLTAIDQKGLLTSGHWTTWLILILTGLTLAFLVITLPKTPESNSCESHFPASFSQGITSLLFAAAIALRTVPSLSNIHDSLELVAAVFGILTATAMAIVGICRFTGKRPVFLCHSILCLFFALQMVNQYRRWSADPQLMNYSFYLLSFVCLMLTSYFLAGFDADMGQQRPLRFFSMAAGFFCCVALPESGDAGLLITGALWSFYCAPHRQVRPRRQRPALILDEETEDENS